MTRLKIRDIDSERMLLRVQCGKGGRHRNAMLAQDLLVLLREWWKIGRQQGVMHADGWLFPGQHYLKPICYQQVHRIAAEAAHAAGITKRVGPHTLRHSFATGGNMIKEIVSSLPVVALPSDQAKPDRETLPVMSANFADH